MSTESDDMSIVSSEYGSDWDNTSKASSEYDSVWDADVDFKDESDDNIKIKEIKLTLRAASDLESSLDPRDASTDTDTPPDGGRDAWLCVLGGFCSWFTTFGWVYSIGDLQEYYSEGPLRYYSPSVVAWISSTEVFFVFACGPVAGKLFDNYGPRGVLLVGSFMHVFGLLAASLGRQYQQIFLAQSVCSGIGASLIYYASLNAVTTWFCKKRATAMGIVTAGSSVGGMVLPLAMSKLGLEVGFPWTLRTLALIFFVMLIVTNLTMKSHLVHEPKPFRPMEFVCALADTPFAVLCLATALFTLGSLLPYNFIVVQAQASGMAYAASNYLLPVMNAASLPGRLISGLVADRLGCFNLVILTSAFAAVFTFGLWIPAQTDVHYFVFAAMSGFTSGSAYTCGATAIAQISELRQIGIRNGTLYFCVSIGVLIGNPIGGVMITQNDENYLYLQIFSGAALAASCILYFVSRSLKTGFLKVKIF